jgi:hypothetical protein
LRTREQTIILILASISIGSGFIILSQRNRFIALDNKYDELETRYDSLLQSHIEAQRRLESEIVYETLKIALFEERITTFSSPTYNTSTVVLSTELIEDVDVPRRIGDYRVLLLSPEEIEAKAEAEGPFLYLLFTKFEPNPEHAIVNIQTAGIFDSVEGIGLGFKLTGTVYQMWIS